MAFPVPSHLPRRASPQDVSSKILSKIDGVTYETLDTALASSWLAELEETIQSTKQRIHERIQSNLPDFERQLQSSKSVQTRLQTLTTNVDALSDTVSNPQTGLIPTLVDNLTKHVALAQESIDSDVKSSVLSHLLQCRKEQESLTSLVQAGKLPEAVQQCATMDSLIEEVPESLKQAVVMEDLKRKFRTTKALAEEQLNDAYSRSINVLPFELIIHSMVQVRQSNATLTLSSILSSLSPASLSHHLATLRRDLTTHFIDYVLKQPTSLSIAPSGTFEYKLTLIPSPPNSEIRTTRLDNVAEILGFLSTHLFSAFPETQKSEFTRSLSKPVASSILNSLIIPSLPSSSQLLPSFLELLRQAVDFEEKYLIGMLESEGDHRMIKVWADGASGHYERQRRDQILASSRAIIMSPEDTSDRFPVEIDLSPEASQPTVVPIQVEEAEEIEDDAWGFGDESGTDSSTKDVEENWGFDDDVEPEPEEPTSQAGPGIQAKEQLPDLDTVNGNEEPEDPWGWNDGDVEVPEDDTVEQSAWDDPWADPVSTSSNSEPDSPTVPTPPVTSPKAATRLEKLASKHKKNFNGSSAVNSSPPLSLPASEQTSPSPPAAPAPAPPPAKKVETRHTRRPSKLTTSVAPKEMYFVSGRTKRILEMVENVLAEGKQFTDSKLFPPSGSEYSSGSVLLQSAPSTLDLYRALYPVKFGKELESPERGMMFSNDCSYLSGEVGQIEHATSLKGQSSSNERLSECQRYLKVLGDSWFDDTIERQRQAVDKTLADGTQGFMYTGDQDRYDECESAMGEVLRDIRRFAQKVKGILTKSKYYTAIGLVADAALSRVLADILELPDIPELESHKLSELCRIFNALEGLFSEDPSQPSFVVAYVPSWLKFSYLSELLEASMADITYLFEEGALVDFEVEELVRLVRALFADTALRTTTINKILRGHPVSQQ